MPCRNGIFLDMTPTALAVAALALPTGPPLPASSAYVATRSSAYFATRGPTSIVAAPPGLRTWGSADAGKTSWPLEPRPEIVRGFELPAKPWLPGHRGVDLAGRPGQPVLAATTGTVTYAGAVAGRGVVTVTTGAARTTYEPVVPEVTVGTAVQPGTVIGHLSAAASHCPPSTCLHWGYLRGKQYLNPLTLIPHRPVRLLPLAAPSPQPLALATGLLLRHP